MASTLRPEHARIAAANVGRRALRSFRCMWPGEIMAGCAIRVTGHRGHVGAPVAGFLKKCGHEVVGFRTASREGYLLDLPAVAARPRAARRSSTWRRSRTTRRAARSRSGAVNVLGTWHVLLAAEAAGVARVICFSQRAGVGIAEGERLPDYFPVERRHPAGRCVPLRLVQAAGRGRVCGFRRRTSIVTVALRPVAVYGPGMQRIGRRWRADPRSGVGAGIRGYGAFVDVSDVATAVECALTARLRGITGRCCAPRHLRDRAQPPARRPARS